MSDSLSDIWKLKQRSKRDSQRHKELVKRAIKSNSKEIINQYDVITTDGDKKIKVPIRYLDQYKFKYGKLFDKKNVGQGLSGKKGDKYKVYRPNENPDGSPSEEEGEIVYEEVTIDEMVNILIDELNLPWMKATENSKIASSEEVFTSIEKKGLYSNIHLKKTLLNNIKRNIVQKKEKLIGDFRKEDLRFRHWEEEIEFSSDAAVYLLMDRSGSMCSEKKEIAKTFYFWMVQFLKRKYKNIELIFIAHDARAYEVSEREFFEISSSGGTKCSSAFKLALDIMKERHHPSKYNNYVFEFSDGDNIKQDNIICLELIKELIPLCRAIGYGEIILDGHSHWFSGNDLLSKYLRENINRTRFVSVSLSQKSDIFKALKQFFNINNMSKVKKDE